MSDELPLLKAIKRWGRAARYLDGVLAVVFAYIAYTNQSWFWASCSAFCVVTAATGPIENFIPWLKRLLVKGKAPAKVYPLSRQQQRHAARAAR